MNVRVVLSVEVDPDTWAMESGCDPRARAVAEDVKGYVLNQVQQAPAGGLLGVKAVR